MTLQNRHKYRVWHKPSEAMYEVYAFSEKWVWAWIPASTTGGMLGTKIINNIVHVPTELELPACELMQCTGLVDKNGIDIYEGDIITTESNGQFYKSVVKWADGTFCLRDCLFAIIDAKWACTWTIVGNVYQNPELMEGYK